MDNLWRHFKDSLWAVKAGTELIQAHLRAMDGRPEVVTTHPGAVKSHAGAMEVHPRVVKSPWSKKVYPGVMEADPWVADAQEIQPRDAEAHPVAEKVYPGPIKADPGVKDVPNGAVEGQPEPRRHWAGIWGLIMAKCMLNLGPCRLNLYRPSVVIKGEPEVVRTYIESWTLTLEPWRITLRL
jgi:hypothetical protein